jgi:hypothetical protein
VIPNVDSHPLFGCWLKISRAREHRDTLNHEVDAWSSYSPPIRIAGKFDPTNDTWTAYLHEIQKCPPQWGTLLGDAVHNYRSALDLLIFELAFIDRGGKEPTGTGFPLVSPENWADPSIQSSVKELTEPHRTLVKASQPDSPTQNGLTHPLLLLSGLANDDKHRVIQPAITLAEGFEFVVGHVQQDCEVIAVEGRPLFGRLEQGAVVLTCQLAVTGPNPYVDVKGNFAFEVCLRNGIVLTNALARFDYDVVTIVERFAPEFETAEAIALRGRERIGRIKPRVVDPTGRGVSVEEVHDPNYPPRV